MIAAAALSGLLLLGTPPVLPPAPSDSVRELHVAVVVYTRSFARTLDAAQIERLQEEIVEFAEFYRRHGGDRVAFRFTLVQLDRELRRHEVGEVAPGRHYLSREDVRADLESVRLGSGVDEFVVFYAWDNANPDGAALAYGGGAVGPDGNYLGDAGYNSIGVFAFDPARISQIAIHEVLHNVDDMFSRAGMPDEFLNSDEMSRNMDRLVAERPGAFEPYFSDAEMLAYAERERAGRDAYPWWMQRIYYAWMLERTPAEQWAALQHGRMVERPQESPLEPLYDDVLVSRATERVYLPALLTAPASANPLVRGEAAPFVPMQWTLEDFDGSPITTGYYLGGWIDAGGGDSVVVVPLGDARMVVHRLRLGDIEAPARVAALAGDTAAGFDVVAREAGWPERGPVLEAAVVGAVLPDGRAVRGTGSVRVPLPVQPGTTVLDVGAAAQGYAFPGARVEAVREEPIRIEMPQNRETAVGSPVGLRVELRTNEPVDARLVARLPDGRETVLTRAPDGSWHTAIDALSPGLHDVEVVARGTGGEVVDTVRVYARPTGWIRVPRTLGSADGRIELIATVRSRMGEQVTSPLPLIAVTGTAVVPLTFHGMSWSSRLTLPDGQHRVYVTSLTGDFQRRVVLASIGGGALQVEPSAATEADGIRFIGAPRMEASPVLDGAPDSVPGLQWLGLGNESHVLSDRSWYAGAADLSARIGMAWREDGLYVAGVVRDDDVTGGEAWDRDRINLVFDWREDTAPLTYASDSPPTSEWQRDDYWVFFQPFDAEGGPGGVRSIGREGQRTLAGARLASHRTSDGYTFELWLPAAELPEFVPFEAQVAGLQLFISDGDTGQPLTELMWSDAWGWSRDGGLAWELSRMGRLVFAGAPLQ